MITEDPEGLLSIKPKEQMCCVCGESLNDGLTFYNYDIMRFKNIPLNSGAHAECYIEKVIEDKFNELADGLDL